MPQCTAKSKRSGERCKRHAAKGSTVCYMHGAGGGGPRPGNKSARTHGGYETLLYGTLTESERAAWDTIDTDITGQIDEQIKLTSIREARLMQRIAEVTGSELVTVQETYAEGIDRDKQTDLRTTVSESSLPMVLKIEEALTRAQAQKARLIDLKYKLSEQSESKGASAILELVGAIRDSAPESTEDDDA